MSWANLDDRLHSHPKVRKLQRVPYQGMAAFGLWCWCLSWCRAFAPKTGLIDAEALALDWHADQAFVEDLLNLLVLTRLLDVIVSEHDGDPIGFQIHDWIDWQITATDEARRRGGLKRAATADRSSGRFAPLNGTEKGAKPWNTRAR